MKLLNILQYKNFAEANIIVNQIFKILDKCKDSNDKSVALSYTNILAYYVYSGDYENAFKYKEKCLNACEHLQGKDHYITAMAYENLSVLYEHQRDYNTAIEFAEKAISIGTIARGENDSTIGRYYKNLSIYSKNIGDNDKALTAGLKSLDIFRKNNESTFLINSHIANIYKSLGDYDKALEYFQEAMVEENIGGINIVTVIMNITQVFLDKKDYKMALFFGEKSLKACNDLLENDPYLTGRAYALLAQVYKAMGYRNEAKEYYEKCYYFFLEKGGETHMHTIRAAEELEKFLNNI